MARSNDDFIPEMVDEQIERFLQFPEQQQQAPVVILTQALRAVCQEDAASLERVRKRYDARIRALPLSAPQSFTNVSLSLQQKKELTMHNLQEKHESLLIQSLPQRKTGWKRRLSVFAAILCTLILVGSAFALFNVIHVSQTTRAGSQIGQTPTPQPTRNPAPQAIQKALLTDSPTGNGEGVGPELSGITPQDQFVVGQRIWLMFIWSANESGTLVVKWFINGSLYSSSSQRMDYLAPYQGSGIAPTPGRQKLPTPGPTTSPTPASVPSVPISGNFTITYNQPAMGKAELYWKGQLATTLTFVVKSKR